MQRPFNPNTRRSSEAQTFAILIGAIGLVCLGFYQSYQLGASGHAGPANEFFAAKTTVQNNIRRQIDECHSDIQEMEQSLDRSVLVSGKLATEMNDLEAQNRMLVDKQAELEQKVLHCTEQAEARHAEWTREDHQNAETSEKLLAEHKELNDRLELSIHGQGMKEVLLDTSMKRFISENEFLRQSLGMNKVDIDEEYLEYLLLKHGDITEQTLELIELESEATHELRRERKLRVVVDRYDADDDINSQKRDRANGLAGEHIHPVFFPQQDASQHYERPTWGGLVGTQPVRMGMNSDNYVNRQPLHYLISMITDFGVCALASRTPWFMFPTHYGLQNTHNVDGRLDELFDTPVVQFCEKCNVHFDGDEFYLACGGRSSDEVYGTLPHWRIRSRVRFNETIVRQAEHAIDEHGLMEALSVKIPGDGQAEWCTKGPRFHLAYKTLLEPLESHKRLYEDATQACAPEVEDLAAKIIAYCKEVGIQKVYVSTDQRSDRVTRFLQAMGDFPVYFDDALSLSVVGQAVDLEILAKTRYLAVNRHDMFSQVAIEGHLLENHLKTDHIISL